MFKKIQLLLILLSVFTLSAQNYQWAKRIGGMGNDNGQSIITDVSGNIYITGNFENLVDFDPSFGVDNLNASGLGGDIFILKLDSSSNLIWAKKIGGSIYEQSQSISVDAIGNVYTTGFFSGVIDCDPGNGTFNLTSIGGGYYIYVLKLDSYGNFIWATSIGQPSQSYLSNCIKSDPIGNTYLTGSFGGGASQYSALIYKLDPYGNFLWTKTFGGSNDVGGMSLNEDSFGNIYVTGYFNGNCDFDPGPGTYSLSSVSGEDIFILKLNSSGNFVWVKSIGGAGDDVSCSIINDASGNIYTTGYFPATVDFDPGPGTFTFSSSGSYDIYISKLNPSGNFVWAKAIGGVKTDQSTSLSMDTKEHLYITGGFSGAADFDPGPAITNLTSKGLWDMFILKIDTAGNFIWAKSMPGSDSTSGSFGYSIITDNFSNVYTTGVLLGTVDFDPDIDTSMLTSGGEYDMFISKLGKCNSLLNVSTDRIICTGETTTISVYGTSSYTWNPGGINSNILIISPTTSIVYTVTSTKSKDCEGFAVISVIIDECTDIAKVQPSDNPISIFPNPNNGEFTIKSSDKTDLKLINELGQSIYSIQLNDKNNFSISISNLANGIYFIVSENGNKKIIINK